LFLEAFRPGASGCKLSSALRAGDGDARSGSALVALKTLGAMMNGHADRASLARHGLATPHTNQKGSVSAAVQIDHDLVTRPQGLLNFQKSPLGKGSANAVDRGFLRQRDHVD